MQTKELGIHVGMKLNLDCVFFRFLNRVLSCCNGFVWCCLSKFVLFLLISFLPLYYHHILIFGCCLSHFHHFHIFLFFDKF
jgi:hypothetical protein